MVQRKVPKKLGIQANHVKPQNELKTPSFQLQDIKNKGPDLKKTMKKSGSFKRPEIERLRSSNMKRQIKHPQIGRPPPQNKFSTPNKPSPIKAVMDTTPNYMKSTTSSDARKDSSLQVSCQNPKPSIRKNSANKAVVRNLTKVPSFKPIRTSSKKSSQIIICENLKVQRATCSSTIKDHKFPAYLTLSPGANEAEGTANMKVCPYTYCSLNGHHRHHTLPPLKSFVLAKRRILKAQRNIKLGCLSPRRKKPVQDTMEEDEKPPSANSSLIQEEQGEYFIEIYSKEKEDLSGSNQDIADCEDSDFKVFVDVQEGFETDNRKEKEMSLSNLLVPFPEKSHNTGVGEKIYSPNSEGKIELDFLDFLCEMEVEGAPSIQSEDTDSENDYVDMDNAGVYIGGLHPGGRKSDKIDDMIDLEKANSLLDNALFFDGVGEVCDESFTGEIMQELIDNENVYETWSGDDDSEFVSSHQNIYDDQNYNRIGSDEHGIGKIDGAQSDEAFLQKINQETEEHRAVSENPMEKFTISIGTQTESEYQHNMSWKFDEVQKRSIGTQTDFEDESKENTCFQIEQVASGNVNNADEKQSIDGIEDTKFQKNSDEDANQTIAGENDKDNDSFSDENNDKESGLNEGDAESVYPSMNRIQEASVTKNSEKHVGSCSPEENVDHNRIIKGNKKVIGENDEQMEFNPRAPNFLKVEQDPDAEKVDLRHLTLDEKRNADDWMVDYALQQALSKLAPARKKKVALLVAAFETVVPTPYESHSRLYPTAFTQGKRVLA